MAIKPRVSIIVPTYNEKENLTTLIKRIHGAFSKRMEYQVSIIDDDSPDGTAALAEQLSQNYPVRVVVRKNARGLATAVVQGFRETETPYLAVIDADLQHPPEELLKLIDELDKDADIAIGSRYVSGGHIGMWGLRRKVTSKVALLLAKFLLPSTRNVADPLSGFFALKRDVVCRASLNPIGYKILLEVLAIGNYNKVVEVPYTFGIREKGETKYNLKQMLNYLQHLWSLAWSTGEIKRFLKFILVGISGIGVNQGILYLLTEYAGMFYLVSSIFATQSAILNNFLWNHLWTFRDRRTQNESILRKLGKFELVSIAGKLTNILVLYLAVTFMGLHYLAANLIGIAIGFIINFIGNNIWTWRR